MTLSEIYTSGIQKQNRGHFANIVKIAKADNKVTIEEQALLFKIAKNLNLSPTNYSKILENPYNFPINPPVNSEDRITRLYGLAKMVLADGSHAALIEQPDTINFRLDRFIKDHKLLQK